MLNWRILWRAVKTAVFLFGLVGLGAWFAQGFPWYALAGSALVVLAVVSLLYQFFAALHARRLGPGRVGGSHDRAPVSSRSGGQSVPKRARAAAASGTPCPRSKPYSPAEMTNVDELPPAVRARVRAAADWGL